MQKEEYRWVGLLNWDGWKGNVPSHIYVLSCQRTEYRTTDCGSGYGGVVKIGILETKDDINLRKYDKWKDKKLRI